MSDMQEPQDAPPSREFLRFGTSWVDPDRVVAVVMSDVDHLRIHLDTGANLSTGLSSTEENARTIVQSIQDSGKETHERDKANLSQGWEEGHAAAWSQAWKWGAPRNWEDPPENPYADPQPGHS